MRAGQTRLWPYPEGRIDFRARQKNSKIQIAEGMDGATPSEGMVIQSPDGRPAIFFQPQTRCERAVSAKEKAMSRPTTDRDQEVPDDAVDMTGRSTPPVRSPVASLHEIGLGQGRRVASNASSGSADSPLRIGTPALTLDSFITAAKSRAQSDDLSSVEIKSLSDRSLTL